MSAIALAQAPHISDDPTFPGRFLFPVGPEYIGLPKCTQADTWYVLARNGNTARLVQMLSDAANGLRLGWDICGGCWSYITRCTCASGLTPPQWVARRLTEERDELA